MVKRKILEIANFFTENSRFGFDQESADKFNFAVIKKTEDNITYEEFWILANCYYDYTAKKFKTVNVNKPCFGIQIQANGTYPGEVAYDSNNIGINVWRHAISSTNTSWDSFGVTSGWYNAFMIDSYGGMTIGGAGFEVDGNGIFPYTRLTSSGYKDSNDNEYYLLGLLDNAYHPTTYDSWQMDDNSTYAWFFGFRTPKKPNEGNSPLKNNENTEFVIMYNDTSSTTINNKHELDIDKWHTVFSVNKHSEYLTNSNIQFFTQNLDSSAHATGTIEYKKWHKMVICDINITPANIQSVDGQDVIKLAHIPQSFKPNSTYTEYNCNNAFFSTNIDSRGVFALDFNTSMNSFLVVVQGFSFSLNEEIKGQLMWFTD